MGANPWDTDYVEEEFAVLARKGTLSSDKTLTGSKSLSKKRSPVSLPSSQSLTADADGFGPWDGEYVKPPTLLQYQNSFGSSSSSNNFLSSVDSKSPTKGEFFLGPAESLHDVETLDEAKAGDHRLRRKGSKGSFSRLFSRRRARLNESLFEPIPEDIGRDREIPSNTFKEEDPQPSSPRPDEEQDENDAESKSLVARREILKERFDLHWRDQPKLDQQMQRFKDDMRVKKMEFRKLQEQNLIELGKDISILDRVNVFTPTKRFNFTEAELNPPRPRFLGIPLSRAPLRPSSGKFLTHPRVDLLLMM